MLRAAVGRANLTKGKLWVIYMTYDCSLKQVDDAYFMEIGCISRNDENTRKHSLKNVRKQKEENGNHSSVGK